MGNMLGRLFGEGPCIPSFLKRSGCAGNESGWFHADAFVALLSAVGMMLVVVWADILGHGLGFEPSASMIASLGNSRLFFLVGFTVAAILSVPLAKYGMSPSLTPARFTAAISVVGTLLYGFAYVQVPLPANVAAIVGLFLCGAGYYAATMLIYCQLAKVRCLSIAVAAVAAALFLKTVIGSQLIIVLPWDVQIIFASLLPVCVFACLVVLDRCDSAALSEYRARKTLSKQGIYDLFFLLVAVSLMLAALRGTSHLGLWGAGFTGSPVSSFMGYAVVGLVLFAFAYLTLIRNSNNQMLVRFQPAFLVLAAGFVLYVLQDSFLEVPGYAQFFEWLYLTVELFGHLLSGTLIIAAIRSSDLPLWCFQGVSDSAFGLLAIPWIFLAQDATMDIRPLMVIAIFLVMVAAIRPMSTRPLEIEQVMGILSSGSSFAAEGVSHRNEVSDTSSPNPPFDQQGESLERRLALCHAEIAKSHSLSARETDVFMLLAQGRSRPYICEALYLSDGTVKTHISHIYRKFDVHGRQELLDAVQSELAHFDPAEFVDIKN